MGSLGQFRSRGDALREQQVKNLQNHAAWLPTETLYSKMYGYYARAAGYLALTTGAGVAAIATFNTTEFRSGSAIDTTVAALATGVALFGQNQAIDRVGEALTIDHIIDERELPAAA